MAIPFDTERTLHIAFFYFLFNLYYVKLERKQMTNRYTYLQKGDIGRSEIEYEANWPLRRLTIEKRIRRDAHEELCGAPSRRRT